MSYVWVIDGEVNLNIELVRKGACDSRTMLVDEAVEANLLVDKQRYLDFKRRIIEAEAIAKSNKSGLWK